MTRKRKIQIAGKSAEHKKRCSVLLFISFPLSNQFESSSGPAPGTKVSTNGGEVNILKLKEHRKK
jgi:hypothetical protein